MLPKPFLVVIVRGVKTYSVLLSIGFLASAGSWKVEPTEQHNKDNSDDGN